jgi:phosphoribosylformylglycinamidine synthase
MPRAAIGGKARHGDRIIAIGGRTGRDGIHGATFSSAELTDTHADEFSHAVQIGNAIEEKRVLDVVMRARGEEREETKRRRDAEQSAGVQTSSPRLFVSSCLFSAITDCGAGGFSSAVGEMAAELGATVHLDRAPLKYDGLSYTEIWISEAQERMVLAVPARNLPAVHHVQIVPAPTRRRW